jgi:hypothetical protein
MALTPRISSGLPADVKPRPRSDFRPEEFDKAIYEKGYRLWWSRAALCPCRNNEQTEQADVNCPLCKGHGYHWFLPDPAIRAGATVDVHGNKVEVNDAKDAVLVQGIMSSFTMDPQIFEKFGEWVFGTGRCTTAPENRLGYRDRLIGVDSLMPWAQLIEYDGSAEIEVTGGFSKKGLRYPFLEVNYFRSVATVFREGSDFELTDDGTIRFLGSSAPAADTRLTVHGAVRPVWICMDHMHTYRDTLVERGAGPVRADQFTRLPLQMMVKLDFLIETW